MSSEEDSRVGCDDVLMLGVFAEERLQVSLGVRVEVCLRLVNQEHARFRMSQDRGAQSKHLLDPGPALAERDHAVVCPLVYDMQLKTRWLRVSPGGNPENLRKSLGEEIRKLREARIRLVRQQVIDDLREVFPSGRKDRGGLSSAGAWQYPAR